MTRCVCCIIYIDCACISGREVASVYPCPPSSIVSFGWNIHPFFLSSSFHLFLLPRCNHPPTQVLTNANPQMQQHTLTDPGTTPTHKPPSASAHNPHNERMLQRLNRSDPLLWIKRQASIQQIGEKGQFLGLNICQTFRCGVEASSEIAGRFDERKGFDGVL